MSSLGEGRYEIVADVDDAVKNLDRFGNESEKTSKKVGSSFGRMAGNLTGLAASVAGTAFAYDNLGKTQLRVERTAQGVVKAQERLNDLIKKGKTHTKDYEIATEDLRLAQERQKQAVSDLQQNQLQFGLGLVTLTTSTIPNAIGSLVKLAAGHGAAAAGALSQTSANTALTASTWRSTFAFLANPIFAIATAASIAAAIALVGTNTWGLRDALFGVTTATNKSTSSGNQLLNTFQGMPAPLKQTGKAAEQTAVSFDILNTSMENIKKNKNWFDNWIEDIPRQLNYFTTIMDKAAQDLPKISHNADLWYQWYVLGKRPDPSMTGRNIKLRGVDIAMANALTKRSGDAYNLGKSLTNFKTFPQLDRWFKELEKSKEAGRISLEDYDALYAIFFAKRVDIIKQNYQDKKDREYKDYIKSVRKSEKSSNLSQLHKDKLNPPTANDELSGTIRDINSLLGIVINLPDAVGGGSSGVLAQNVRNQLKQLNAERNFTQTRTMGISVQKMTAGLDQFFRDIKASGSTSGYTSLMGGGLGQFGGFSQSLVNSLNNSPSNIAKLLANSIKGTGISNLGGNSVGDANLGQLRTGGINIAGVGFGRGTVSSQGGRRKRGKGRGNVAGFARGLELDDLRSGFPDFFTDVEKQMFIDSELSISNIGNRIKNSWGMQGQAIAEAQKYKRNYIARRLLEEQSRLTNLSNLSGYTIAEIKVMETTNQGRDDLTGVIDYNKRKNMITNGVA